MAKIMLNKLLSFHIKFILYTIIYTKTLERNQVFPGATHHVIFIVKRYTAVVILILDSTSIKNYTYSFVSSAEPHFNYLQYAEPHFNYLQ